jgi:hypothetical protein
MADEPLADEEGLFLPRVNGTAIADLGHSCAEVPKSPHIAAHPHVFQIAAVRRAAAKPLQVVTFAAGWSRRWA